MQGDDVVRLYVVDKKIHQYETTTVDVEFDGDWTDKRLWVHGASGTPWPMNTQTMLSMEENPIPIAASFEITGNLPGKYAIYASVLDGARIEARSGRVDVEVVLAGESVKASAQDAT